MLDLIGYAAVIFSVISFLSMSTFKMRIYGSISVILFAISIYSYGGINGVFISIISLIYKLLLLKYNEEQLKYIHYLSFPLAIIFFYFFNEEGYIGILPAISLIFIMYADKQTSIVKMKYIYFGSAVSWLVYGVALGSIPAITYDIVGISALVYSTWKEKVKEYNAIIYLYK